MYELFRGKIPTNKMVLHSCDNTKCARLEHLFLGSQADNMRDMTNKGRRAKGEKHGNSMLLDAERNEIKKAYKKGVSQAELARKFSVSHSSIWKLLNREGLICR